MFTNPLLMLTAATLLVWPTTVRTVSPVATGQHHHVHLTVTTPQVDQKVRVHWRVACVNDGAAAGMRGHLHGLTPIRTTLPTPMERANWCHASAWARNLTGSGKPRVIVEVTP